jgi:hypothetical protein
MQAGVCLGRLAEDKEGHGDGMLTQDTTIERLLARTGYQGLGERDAIFQTLAILYEGANIGGSLAGEGDRKEPLRKAGHGAL